MHSCLYNGMTGVHGDGLLCPYRERIFYFILESKVSSSWGLIQKTAMGKTRAYQARIVLESSSAEFEPYQVSSSAPNS